MTALFNGASLVPGFVKWERQGSISVNDPRALYYLQVKGGVRDGGVSYTILPARTPPRGYMLSVAKKPGHWSYVTPTGTEESADLESRRFYDHPAEAAKAARLHAEGYFNGWLPPQAFEGAFISNPHHEFGFVDSAYSLASGLIQAAFPKQGQGGDKAEAAYKFLYPEKYEAAKAAADQATAQINEQKAEAKAQAEAALARIRAEEEASSPKAMLKKIKTKIDTARRTATEHPVASGAGVLVALTAAGGLIYLLTRKK